MLGNFKISEGGRGRAIIMLLACRNLVILNDMDKHVIVTWVAPFRYSYIAGATSKK